jgi:uncharacterized protein YggU (UPF0235/DUF167 family)
VNSPKYHLHDSKGGSALAVRITPRSAKNEIVEVVRDGTVRIRLTVENTGEGANRALVNFLSQALGVEPSHVEVVAGMSGNDKLVSILNMDSESVHRKILSLL